MVLLRFFPKTLCNSEKMTQPPRHEKNKVRRKTPTYLNKNVANKPAERERKKETNKEREREREREKERERAVVIAFTAAT